MSTTPVFLNENSAGAPVLNNEAGSLYNIFKWALPQFGWTIEHDIPAESKIMFRNSPVTGSGIYLRIYDDSAFGGMNDNHRARHAVFLTAGSMTPAGTKFPLIANQDFIPKANYTSPTTGREYDIFGDERFFYFLPRLSINFLENRGMFLCGNVVPLYPADSSPAVAGFSGSSGWGSSTQYSMLNSGLKGLNNSNGLGEWMVDMQGNELTSQKIADMRCFHKTDISHSGSGLVSEPPAMIQEHFPIGLYFEGLLRAILPGIYHVSGTETHTEPDRVTLTARPNAFGGTNNMLLLFGHSGYPMWEVSGASTDSSKAAFVTDADWWSLV